MTDNLAQMIFEKQENPVTLEDMLSNEKVANQPTENLQMDPTETTIVKKERKPRGSMKYEYATIPFPEWFTKYSVIFNEDVLRHVKLSCRGLDSRETMAFLVPHPDGGMVGGEPKRKLVTKENADRHHIPDITPESMTFFVNDCFMITAHVRDNIYLSVYVQKVQTFYTFAQKIEDQIVPYAIVKAGKKVDGINIETTRINIPEKLTTPVNKEDMILLYPQFLKVHEEVTTKMDVVKWFNERKKTISDIHHLLQIDNLILLIIR